MPETCLCQPRPHTREIEGTSHLHRHWLSSNLTTIFMVTSIRIIITTSTSTAIAAASAPILLLLLLQQLLVARIATTMNTTTARCKKRATIMQNSGS